MRFFLLKLGECSLIMTLLGFLYCGLEEKLWRRGTGEAKGGARIWYSAKTRYLIWVAGVIGFLLPVKPSPFPGFLELFSQEPQVAVTAGNAVGPAAGVSWLWTVLFILWMLGAWLTFVIRMNRHFAWLHQARRLSAELSDEERLNCLRGLQEDMRIRRWIEVRVSPVLSTPMITGCRRPLLLLPDREYEPEMFRLIAKHELCHYKRKDLWFKWALFAVSFLHWFNPFVKGFCRRAEEACELACDEQVVASEGLSARKCYCQALLRTAREQVEAQAACTSAFYSGRENLQNRMEAVLNMEKKRRRPLLFVLAVCLIAGSGFLLGNPGRLSSYGEEPEEAVETTVIMATTVSEMIMQTTFSP